MKDGRMGESMSLMFPTNVEISVVAPMKNEQECAAEFCRRIVAALEAIGESFEVIIVDDGSTDRTAKILRAHSAADERFQVLTLSRNCGQWAAVYAGLQHSRGEYVVVMDADLQNLPEEIHLLLDEIRQGYDLVSGDRRNRSENALLRRLPSMAANFLLRRTTGCQVRDMGGFKCLRGDVARELRLRAGHHRLLPALVHLMGGRISEIPVSCPPRFGGESHYGLGRSLDVLFDIVMLWFQSSFKSRPLYLFGRVSLFLFAFGSTVLAWLLYDKFARGVDMGSRPPFVATVVIFLSSLGFMSLGFVLELLSDTLHAVTDRKPYRIRSIEGGNQTSKETLRDAA